jgi:hypothetical protein
LGAGPAAAAAASAWRGGEGGGGGGRRPPRRPAPRRRRRRARPPHRDHLAPSHHHPPFLNGRGPSGTLPPGGPLWPGRARAGLRPAAGRTGTWAVGPAGRRPCAAAASGGDSDRALVLVPLGPGGGAAESDPPSLASAAAAARRLCAGVRGAGSAGRTQPQRRAPRAGRRRGASAVLLLRTDTDDVRTRLDCCHEPWVERSSRISFFLVGSDHADSILEVVNNL